MSCPSQVFSCAACWYTSTWRLPVSGHVASLVIADPGAADDGGAEDAIREVRWVSGSVPVRKRIRLNRENPAHLAGLVVQSRPRAWKRLRNVGFQFFLC